MSLHHIIKPNMKAAFYARYSTAKQNIETQRAFVEKFIKSYKCEKIDDEYLDENVSARKNKLKDRKSLMRLINDVSSKKFDLVVVYQQDRLSRDPSEHLYLRSLFANENIPIVVASTHTLYDTGDLLTNIFRDGLSQYEVETLRIRTRDTLATLHQQGLWTGGKAPFGYKYDSKCKLIIADEDELIVVKDIFRLFNEKLGLQTIATLINKRYFAEKPEATLNKQRIKGILLNPIYAGYLIHRKGMDISSWSFVQTNRISSPIMSLDEWKNTHTLYTYRKFESKHNVISQTEFLLRGLLYCAKCNQKLQHKNQINSQGHGSSWYWCRSIICNYKLQVNEVHDQCEEFLKLLIDDFNGDLREHADHKRQQLIDVSIGQLSRLQYKIDETKKILLTLDAKLNKLTPAATNIITNINIAQQLSIIDMLKHYRKEIEEEYQNLLSESATVERKKTMYEASDFITRSLSVLSASDLEIKTNDLNIYQRLIFQLVEKIIIYPVGTPNKKHVLDHVELEIQLNHN